MSDTITLQLVFPAELAALLGPTSQASAAARELIVLGLYQERRISGDRAAEPLGLTRREFVALLARKGIGDLHRSSDEWRRGPRLPSMLSTANTPTQISLRSWSQNTARK